MNLYEYVHFRRKRNKNFHREEINSFLQQMLEVLADMQKNNLAHRDVKPENILYNKGTYLLCDFDDVIDFNHQERQPI